MCKRVENPEWGTVDYIDTESQSGNVIFRTVPEVREKGDIKFLCEHASLHPHKSRMCVGIAFGLFIYNNSHIALPPHLDQLAGT